jgi:hypothetical protein
MRKAPARLTMRVPYGNSLPNQTAVSIDTR